MFQGKYVLFRKPSSAALFKLLTLHTPPRPLLIVMSSYCIHLSLQPKVAQKPKTSADLTESVEERRPSPILSPTQLKVEGEEGGGRNGEVGGRREEGGGRDGEIGWKKGSGGSGKGEEGVRVSVKGR